jgi:disulfide bond formation protein DsbB
MTRRLANGAGALICAGLMGFALFAQYGLELEPCPLCVFQRIGMSALGLTFLVAWMHNPARLGARLYGLLELLVAVAGGAVSARHLWLQNLPADQVPECGPGLDYMLEVFPLAEALKMVFSGSGECAEISWSFLGVSMPGWVLLWFTLLGLGGFLANWMLERRETGGRPL